MTADQIAALHTRIADIADEAFGPFPIQSVDDNLSEIEQGIFRQRQNIEQLEVALRAEIEAHLASRTRLEDEHAKAVAIGAERAGHLSQERDEALGRLALAKSSLGSVPMADHIELMKAASGLAESINTMLDVAGYHLTPAMRRELDQALNAARKAIGRG